MNAAGVGSTNERLLEAGDGFTETIRRLGHEFIAQTSTEVESSPTPW